jgi:hypothetical protein
MRKKKEKKESDFVTAARAILAHFSNITCSVNH